MLQKEYLFAILNLFMIKKIDIAGIQLDNYTVREAIMIAEKMLSNNEFNMIEEVDMETLKCAKQDESIRNLLMELDNTVIADVGILKAVNEVSMQRQHEIQDRDFFYELMKRIERNHKNVYVIASDQVILEKVADYIESEFSRIQISGTQIVSDMWNSSEDIVNEINSTGVDVILSILPSPMQEHFLAEYKNMLLANLWYGVSVNNFSTRKRGLKSWIEHMVDVHKLAFHVNNYEG